jgi:hypothetical protein
MKTISNASVKISDDGKSVTITAELVDAPWSEMLTTRVTHPHLNPDNIKHVRHVQSSNAAVFVRHGCHALAVPNDVFVAIAAAIEPKTSFPPVFKQGTVPPTVEVISECCVSFQWQVSDDAFPKAAKPDVAPEPAVWTDIEGQTTNTIDETKVAKGKWVRVIATNASGSTISQPAQVK